MSGVKDKQELPENFYQVVETIIQVLASKYTFGIHSTEDISQEIYILCLEAVRHPKFDKTRNLYNFLFTHTKHRLKNFKRNKYFRYECPCKLCSFKENGETGHIDKKHCTLYLKWFKSNMLKKNLACPTHVEDNIEVYDEKYNHESQVDMKDFLAKIDEDMPTHLRESYLKLKSGINISNTEKVKVLQFLKKYTDDI